MSLKIAGRLFTQKRFLPLFTLFQAGTFNDNALKNSLISLVVFGGMVLFSDTLPRPAIISIAALLFTMPFLILCTIAGQIADKVDRGLVLKWIKRAEMAIMIIAAIGFFLQSPYILAFTLFCMGAQSAFFSPTKNAVLPQWLSDDELITGNSLMSGFQFFFILLGMAVGTMIVMLNLNADMFWTGPRIIAVLLLFFAIVGWLAAEKVPSAPAPQPNLKIDYNPLTSIYNVMKTSIAHMDVFRPMMGVAWFYGFSNVLVLALPTFVADVMQYDQNVLTAILVSSTLGILTGSLLCVVLARGREAMGLIMIGILGVTLFTLDLYLNTEPSTRAVQGGFDVFKADPGTPRFLFSLMGASVCAGLYVVPLQAMMQRRSSDELRARLMSAGSVLVNAMVNVVTFGLIGLSFTAMPPAAPFLFIVFVSAFVVLYTARRVLQIRKLEKS